MTSTADRLRLYEHAKETWGDEPARTLMELLPADPSELATKSDLAVLRAELREEMAQLRGELRSELHQALTEQTRTLGMWMIGMIVTSITFSVGSVVAVAAVT